MNDVSAIIMEIGNNGEWGIGNGEMVNEGSAFLT
jgi:hypothetical protein